MRTPSSAAAAVRVGASAARAVVAREHPAAITPFFARLSRLCTFASTRIAPMRKRLISTAIASSIRARPQTTARNKGLVDGTARVRAYGEHRRHRDEQFNLTPTSCSPVRAHQHVCCAAGKSDTASRCWTIRAYSRSSCAARSAAARRECRMRGSALAIRRQHWLCSKQQEEQRYGGGSNSSSISEMVVISESAIEPSRSAAASASATPPPDDGAPVLRPAWPRASA